MLSDRLAGLEQQGLVQRLRHSRFPPRTVYCLTTAGRRLRPLLIELYNTGQAVLHERSVRAGT